MWEEVRDLMSRKGSRPGVFYGNLDKESETGCTAQTMHATGVESLRGSRQVFIKLLMTSRSTPLRYLASRLLDRQDVLLPLAVARVDMLQLLHL